MLNLTIIYVYVYYSEIVETSSAPSAAPDDEDGVRRTETMMEVT